MTERTFTFGHGGRLVGTICLPDTPAGGPPGVGQILFNAGVLHRVGPHRLNVRLARRLARRGIPSLRFDLSGLGDSDRSDSSLSFDEQAVTDLRAAMDALGEAAGVRRFALLGFCSGARHGFATAAVDGRVAGLVLHDGYTYATRRSRRMTSLRNLRRDGLMGAVRGWSRARVARLSAAIQGWLGRNGARPPVDRTAYVFSRAPTKTEYAQRIREFHDRGIRVLVTFSGESASHHYREQFADAFEGEGVMERIAYYFVPEMDHTVTLLSWQAEFMGRLEAWTVSLDEECRKDRPAAGRPTAALPR